ncbi:hypothetical protein [Paramixta manurensis]
MISIDDARLNGRRIASRLITLQDFTTWFTLAAAKSTGELA